MSIYSDTAPVSPDFWGHEPEPQPEEAASWDTEAACPAEVGRLIDLGVPTDEAHGLWFPLQADCEGVDAEHAKVVCNGGKWHGRPDFVYPTCPVRETCLAKNLDQKHGVFGGTTPAQREGLRRRQARKQQREVVSA